MTLSDHPQACPQQRRRLPRRRRRFRKRNSIKNRPVGLESLEQRRLLAVVSEPFVSSTFFDQFTGDAPATFGFGVSGSNLPNVEAEPKFFGFEFDSKNKSVGNITSKRVLDETLRFGIEASARIDGRLGVEVGFYANGGTGHLENRSAFEYELIDDGSGTLIFESDVVVDQSKLRTLSPTIGTYADLIFEVDAEFSADACFFVCVPGNPGLNIDEEHRIALASINRSVFDGEAPNGEVAFLDTGVGGQVAFAIQDARDRQTRANIDDDPEAANEARRDERDANNRDGTDEVGGGSVITVEFASTGDEGVLGARADIGVGAEYRIADLSANLGSLALTLPNLNLDDTSFGSNDLSASTDGFSPFRTEGDESFPNFDRNLLSGKLNLGTILGGGYGLGNKGISAGELSADLTTFDYELTTALNVNQVIESSLSEQLITLDFSGPVDATVNGMALNDVRELTFEVGSDVQIVSPNEELSVTPSLDQEMTLSNTFGLDVALLGKIRALVLELSAFKYSKSLGPLFSDAHEIADFDLGEIFNGEFTVDPATESFDPFRIGGIRTDVSLDIDRVRGEDGSNLLSDRSGLFLEQGEGAQTATFTIMASNTDSFGETATNTIVSSTLPPEFTLDATGSDDRCTVSADGKVVTCDLGDIPSGASEQFDVKLVPDDVSGINTLSEVAVSFGVSSDQRDVDSANDVNTRTIKVFRKPALWVDEDLGDVIRENFDPLICLVGCGLREAIVAANGTTPEFVGPDTIVLLIPARLERPVAITESLTVQGRISSIAIGPLTGSDPDLGRHHLFDLGGDGENEYVFRNLVLEDGRGQGDGGVISLVDDDDRLVVEKVTFRNNSAVGDGGAIRVTSGDLDVINSTFINNTSSSDHGGAIRVFDGTTTVVGSSFTDNTADKDGGAIRITDGSLVIDESTFDNNHASEDGGAIRTQGALLEVSNSTFTGNSADSGGAVRVENANAVLSLNVFASNVATDDGGAVSKDSDGGLSDPTTTLSVDDSLFFDNSSPSGAAVSSTDSEGGITSLFIRDSAFFDNEGSSNVVLGFGTQLNQQGGNISDDTTPDFDDSADRLNTEPITLDRNELLIGSDGAIVGGIALNLTPDATPGDVSAAFTVSDARFEVRGEKLRLKEGHVVSTTDPITLSLTAVADSVSISRSFTITPRGIPTTPLNFVANAEAPTTVELTFDEVAEADEYRILVVRDGAVLVDETATESPVRLESLPANTALEFSVTGVNFFGNSDPATTSLTTPILPPTIVQNVTTTVDSPTQISITWEDSLRETGYRVLQVVDGTAEEVVTLSADQTSALISGLDPDSDFVFLVESFNEGGATLSPEASESTPPLAPTEVVNTRTEVVSNSLRLIWDDSQNEDGYAVLGNVNDSEVFEVLMEVDGGVTTFDVADLEANRIYQFAITAINETESVQSSDFFFLAPDVDSIIDIDSTRVLVRSDNGDQSTMISQAAGRLDLLATEADNLITLVLSDPTSRPETIFVDGLGGVDVLQLDGPGASVNLTDIQAFSALNFSTIDLSDNALAAVITLDADAVERLVDQDEVLLVTGGVDDDIAFADAPDWRMGNTETVGGRFLRSIVNLAGVTQTIQVDLPTAWQNVVQASDVNNNGEISSVDALVIINELSRRVFSSSADGQLLNPQDVPQWPGQYFDQNGDNRATALDALRVINTLTRLSLASGEQITGTVVHPAINDSNLPHAEEDHVLSEGVVRVGPSTPKHGNTFGHHSPTNTAFVANDLAVMELVGRDDSNKMHELTDLEFQLEIEDVNHDVASERRNHHSA